MRKGDRRGSTAGDGSMSTPKTYEFRLRFPVPVEISREAHSLLVDAADLICGDYEKANPKQIMWPSTFGALMTVNPLALSDNEPIPFDDSIEVIECTERERFEDEPIRDRTPHIIREMADLRSNCFVPGLWNCPKCKFTLMQSNLNAKDGTVTARDTPGDKCPNCNKPLWRVSERTYRKELEKLLDDAYAKIDELQEKRA
jgi:ssDNA-binding Zn-finger/Zn-ribbon topoisomerase 1